MKNFNKILSVLLVMCMCMSLIPSTLVFAEDRDYVTRGASIPSDFMGHVVKYNVEDEESGLIRLDVGTYNAPASNGWVTGIQFDSNVLNFCFPDGGDIEVPDDYGIEAFVIGKITDSMVDPDSSSAASYRNKDLTDSNRGFLNPLPYTATVDTETNIGRIYRRYELKTGLSSTTKSTVLTFDDDGLYTFPEDEFVVMYSVYLKTINNHTIKDITSNTIRMAEGDDNKLLTDGVFGSSTTDGSGGPVNQYTHMVGFPYDVTFNVTDGSTAVNGATVNVYEKDTETLVGKGTTDSDGEATISLVPGEYEYTVTATGFDNGSGTFSAVDVGSIGVEGTDSYEKGVGVSISLTAKVEQVDTYTITWNFTDADENPLEGVAIAVSSLTRATVANLTTNKEGTASTQLESGSYTYSATLEGYVDITDQAFTVEAGAKTLATVKMTKEDVPTFAYKFKITDTTGNALPGAKVTVYNAAGDRKVAEDTADEDGIVTFSLEEGDYMYSVTSGIAYVGTAKTTFRVSSVEAENTTNEVPLTPATENGEAHYKVIGDYDEASGKYKVDVTLNNTYAVGASFGLKYDSEIFTLILGDDVAADDGDTDDAYEPKYHADIEPTGTVAEQPDASYAPQQNAEGYVTFGWNAKNDGNVIDGTAAERPVIVTYYFDINPDMLAEEEWKNWIDSETFQVMPWTDTEQGATEDPEVAKDIWSVDESKYMGFVLIADSEGNFISDDIIPIGMEFKYDNQERYRLTFTVTEQGDADTTISGATIDIYDVLDPDTNLGPAREKADEPGVYEIVVNGDTSYDYIVKAEDYWSNPESEKRDEYLSTGEITAPTDIAVELRAKVYRDVIANVTSGTIISEGKGGTQDVVDTDPTDEIATSKTWTEHATEGVNLYFVTSPSAGYELAADPTYTIGDDGTATTASFDTATNQWYVPGNAIDDKVTIDVTYQAGTFKVTANLNAGGTLTWDHDGDSTATDFTSVDAPVEKAEIAMGSTSGELAFDADDANGYEIYQVVIDGSEYPFANKDRFEHTFDNIRDDHTISVIFKKTDAENPEEYVVSVLAGEYGKVDVSYGHETDTLDGEAAKDYIVPWATNFTATATPDDKYEIDEMLKNGVAETLDPDHTKPHSVELSSSAGATQSVVATFKAEGAEESIQYWIKTEIVGMGTIVPFGSRLYYSYETPTFKFKPATLWKTESITFNGVDMTDQIIKEGEEGEEEDGYPYTFTELTEDVVIVATYTEIVRPFSGVVNFAQGRPEPAGEAIEQTDPEVVFVRDIDGKEFTAEISDVSTFAFRTGSTDKTFTAYLPDGTYTIKATKGGHLDYVITGFEVAIDEGATADIEDSGTVEGKIVLTPGNTNKDNYITFMDILRVVNGMVRYGEGAADIDETGIVGLEDMNFAKANYAESAVNVDYEAHKIKAGSGS